MELCLLWIKPTVGNTSKKGIEYVLAKAIPPTPNENSAFLQGVNAVALIGVNFGNFLWV